MLGQRVMTWQVPMTNHLRAQRSLRVKLEVQQSLCRKKRGHGGRRVKRCNWVEMWRTYRIRLRNQVIHETRSSLGPLHFGTALKVPSDGGAWSVGLPVRHSVVGANCGAKAASCVQEKNGGWGRSQVRREGGC